jgi:hypothetical protein
MTKERSKLTNLVTKDTKEEEAFQNLVLRPIIKMQHHLIIAFFESYLKQRKILFNSFSKEKKISIIKSSLEKDIVFKNKVLGVILGHLSIKEYQTYSTHSGKFNRRIKQIIIQRLQDTLIVE